jgi:(S)-ureidoglycine aminohydrolase
MPSPLGHTRSTVQRDHALIAPDSQVPSPVAGWSGATAHIVISPRIGAEFSEILVDLDARGRVGLPQSGVQRFLWVREGAVSLRVDGKAHELTPGGYAFLPADRPHTLTARRRSKIALIEKPAVSAFDVGEPWVVVGDETKVKGVPLGGDAGLIVKVLLPADPAFDMAVNTMAFAPGAALSLVEVHDMEHGLLMLEGTAVYRLGDHWHTIQVGDVVYMAPYCPQWAVGYGKTTAKYLLYKDWNRDPLTDV